MLLNDAIVGVLLVVFAIAEIAYSTTFPTLHGQDYGPGLFPILIGCCLMACGLVLIVRGLGTRRLQMRLMETANPEDDEASDGHVWIQWGDWASDRSRRINMLLVPGLLIAYVLLSDLIGFIPLSIVILAVLLYRFGSSLLASLAIAVPTTILLQLLFAKLLLVPLPSGLLLRWLG